MFLSLRNKSCPGCGAPHGELLPDTRLAGRLSGCLSGRLGGDSVVSAFLAGILPELVVWLAVGAGLLAGGRLGVTVGIVVFGLLLWGAWWLERSVTVFLCPVCGRISRYTELVKSG
jgi:hypothetical protein